MLLVMFGVAEVQLSKLTLYFEHPDGSYFSLSRAEPVGDSWVVDILKQTVVSINITSTYGGNFSLAEVQVFTIETSKFI